jgi:phospho-N-acetylmuramoyl-pentapeptide-transferase
MLYHIFYPLREYFFGFNVFKYITFRAALAALTAMVLTLLLGPYVIRKLYELKIGQNIRKEECLPLYALHKNKQGTPTMGGVLIVMVVALSTFLWADLLNDFVWIVLISIVFFGMIGFLDDYLKLRSHSSKGLTARQKLLAQTLMAFAVGAYFMWNPNTRGFATSIYVPFMKSPIIKDMGLIYLLVIMFVIIGSSNAVNLTDGLDGLAIGCMIIAMTAFTALAYVVGHANIAKYLGFEHIRGAGELAIFCSAIIGAGLGFLWYNSHPAQVFMGDTGSLALGGTIGIISVLIKKELYLLVIGGVFVFEAISVILQVGSYKIRKKRIFAMAPFHHHLEMKGWPETKIVVRLWIVAIIFALIGLSTLKMR